MALGFVMLLWTPLGLETLWTLSCLLYFVVHPRKPRLVATLLKSCTAFGFSHG
jgi:hypothetical protein